MFCKSVTLIYVWKYYLKIGLSQIAFNLLKLKTAIESVANSTAISSCLIDHRQAVQWAGVYGRPGV
jgi:hypothetical protein